jgi:hypothetical protein
VRALALDGAYDPNRYANDPYGYDRGQYVAVEGALNRFLAWCAGAGTACHFGAGDPAAALDRLIGRLDRDAVAVNAFWLLYHLVFAMDEGTPYWATLADRLRAAESGEGGLLTPISRQTAEFLTANTVVECSDRVFPTSGRLLARKLAQEARLGRRLAPALAYGPPGYDHSHAPACSRWRSPRRSRYSGPFSARGAPPILVVGTTGDPDTPYPDAVALADTLDRAWLLTFHGEGHTGLAHSRCAAEVITRYLVERTRPAVEVCDDNPPPG